MFDVYAIIYHIMTTNKFKVINEDEDGTTDDAGADKDEEEAMGDTAEDEDESSDDM